MIIIFGPAGSGKSTQGKILANKFGWRWLSVGQVIRETGKFEEITKRGELVDNKIVIGLMNKEIEHAEAEGVELILDGYPRDVEQAKYIVSSGMYEKVNGVIVLEVAMEELWKRIKERGRVDDVEEVVKRRFEIYEQNICSILPILEEKGVKVVKVDGVGSYNEVTERLCQAILKIVPDAVEVKGYFGISAQENDCEG